MKKNVNIKKEAYKIVINYERRNRRVAKLVEKEGYDILSKGRKEIRHIEVKGTLSDMPSFRFLTKNEFKVITNDLKSYLYLVCGIGKKPKIYIFDRDGILLRYRGIELNHVIVFRRNDFR